MFSSKIHLVNNYILMCKVALNNWSQLKMATFNVDIRKRIYSSYFDVQFFVFMKEIGKIK